MSYGLLVGLSLFALLALYEFDLQRGTGAPQSSQLQAIPYHNNHSRQKLLGNASRLAVNPTTLNCPRRCGNVSIPYPFGLSLECARSPYFVLECTSDLRPNMSAEGEGPWPLLTYGNGTYTVDRYNTTDRTHIQRNFAVNAFQVQSIDPGSIIINVTAIKAMGCDEDTGTASVSLDPASPYWITAENEFFVAGCRSVCSLTGDSIDSTCGPLMCANQHKVHFCGPYDCCIQPIQWARSLSLTGGGIAYEQFENCGFCSLIYRSTYLDPQANDGGGIPIGRGIYGLQLAWSIVDTNSRRCSAAQVDTESYECSQNAACHDSATPEPVGYFCACELRGYQGDGYKNGTGCLDIDECVSGNSCTEVAQCENVAGSYKCNCPPGMTGNGIDKKLNVSGTGCTWINKCENETLNDCSKDAQCTFDGKSGTYSCSCRGDTVGDGHDRRGGTGCKSKSNAATVIGVSSAAGIVFLAMNLSLLWFIYRKRKHAYGLAIFSAQDLVDELEKHEGAKYCKIFTYSDLQEATNDFSPDRKLGEGGFGTVFEGTLKDGTRVAIKKAGHGVGEMRNDGKQFVNEIVILSQVNHRNLVRLMGCCLEKEVPVLVYEYVPNGDLQGHINFSSDAGHESETRTSPHPPLNWSQRLKIAVETAEALNYLHWGTNPPIYHHDVKCANILLDNEYNVKVADFGLSKLVSLDSAEAATRTLGGTPGYLDPAFFDTWQLTDKSDVYSYGIVLLVLLTGQKPVDLARQPRDQNLAVRCQRLMTEGLLIVNLDRELGSFLQDTKSAEAINEVAKVAMKCVSRYTDDRPTMKEVLTELQAIEFTSRQGKTSKSKTVHFLVDDSGLLHADGHASSDTFNSIFEGSFREHFPGSQSSSFQIEWPNSESGQRAGKTSVKLGTGEDKVSPR